MESSTREWKNEKNHFDLILNTEWRHLFRNKNLQISRSNFATLNTGFPSCSIIKPRSVPWRERNPAQTAVTSKRRRIETGTGGRITGVPKPRGIRRPRVACKFVTRSQPHAISRLIVASIRTAFLGNDDRSPLDACAIEMSPSSLNRTLNRPNLPSSLRGRCTGCSNEEASPESKTNELQ